MGYASRVWHDPNTNGIRMCDTGWRRLIGSPKLQIIFHKRATKYGSLLRKMTCKDKGSYESSPPCISMCNTNGSCHTHDEYKWVMSHISMRHVPPVNWPNTVCCSVLQCVAVCCSVLQCVAVCCSRRIQIPAPSSP